VLIRITTMHKVVAGHPETPVPKGGFIAVIRFRAKAWTASELHLDSPGSLPLRFPRRSAQLRHITQSRLLPRGRLTAMDAGLAVTPYDSAAIRFAMSTAFACSMNRHAAISTHPAVGSQNGASSCIRETSIQA
jgi:hypothetical protein